MSGTGGNTDKVPYNPVLERRAGRRSGATRRAPTRSRAAGTGSAQAALPVYGLVPSANYTPRHVRRHRHGQRRLLTGHGRGIPVASPSSRHCSRGLRWPRPAACRYRPVSLSLQARQNAEGLWLSNTGENIVHAQGPRLSLDAGRRCRAADTVARADRPPADAAERARRSAADPRQIRPGAPAGRQRGAEEAYRVIVDELPVDAEKRKGLQFVLRYSLPVFIETAGSASSQPQLRWTLRRDGERMLLEVAATTAPCMHSSPSCSSSTRRAQRTEAHRRLARVRAAGRADALDPQAGRPRSSRAAAPSRS
jgi:hypothetical protein